MSGFDRYRVVDLAITGARWDAAIGALIRRAGEAEGGYACFVNAHVAVESRKDLVLRSAVNNATYAFPDGKPVYLVGRYLEQRPVDKISGPDVLGAILADPDGRRLKHFFYGASEETLAKLLAHLQEQYPGVQIVGAISPPFRQLTEDEKAADLARIRDSDAQMLWVGLGAPKQEIWMQDNARQLPGIMMMGVGAAFDFHAGTVKRAPQWAQQYGLEWLHRLLQEPGRLWKRYLVTNTCFLAYTIGGVLRKRDNPG